MADDVEMVVEDDQHSSTVADPTLNHDEIPDYCTSTQYGDEIVTNILQQEVSKKKYKVSCLNSKLN